MVSSSLASPHESRVDQLATMCAHLTEMPGVHDVPVGWCDHCLVSVPGVSSRIITNVDDIASSLKTNSKYITKRTPLTSLSSLSYVFEDVLKISGGQGLTTRRSNSNPFE
eukprot:7859712-Karenia_brevis.AAC.1